MAQTVPNVTTTEPEGDVIITAGNEVIFDKEGNIEFKSGFETESGASFEVK